MPAIFINNSLIKENIQVDLILSAMCVKLSVKLDICKTYTEKLNWNRQEPGEIIHNLILFGLIIIASTSLILVVLLGIKVFIGFNFRDKMKNDIEKHVGSYLRVKNFESSDDSISK